MKWGENIWICLMIKVFKLKRGKMMKVLRIGNFGFILIELVLV